MTSIRSLLLSAPLWAALTLLVVPASVRAQGTAGACRPGAKLEVLYNGTWYPATVKSAPDAQGRCLIGYDGWDANWDERVGPDRMRVRGQAQPATAPTAGAQGRSGTPASAAAGATGCRSGSRLEVYWGGAWWPATVKSGPDPQGRCFVAFDNYEAKWDQWAHPDHMRIPGETQPLSRRGKPAHSDELRVGEYVCTGYGGRIAYGMGFKVLPGRRYTDLSGRNAGTYSIDVHRRTITFHSGGWKGQDARNLHNYVFYRYENGREVNTCRPMGGGG